jgi:hypothetical protein
MASSSARVIPPDLNPEILAKAGEAWSGDRIAKWLGEVHQVQVGGHAVRALLRKLREERRETAQAVVQNELAGKLTADLDAVEWLGGRARRLGLKAEKRGELGVALRAVEVELSVRETRIRLAGGAPTGAGMGEPARVSLLAKMQRLLDQAEQSVGIETPTRQSPTEPHVH